MQYKREDEVHDFLGEMHATSWTLARRFGRSSRSKSRTMQRMYI